MQSCICTPQLIASKVQVTNVGAGPSFGMQNEVYYISSGNGLGSGVSRATCKASCAGEGQKRETCKQDTLARQWIAH